MRPKTDLIHLFACLLGLALAATAAGCGSDSCVQGEACVCTSDCNESCDGKGCGFTCADGADCAFSCPEGGCSVECTNAAGCALDCPGGGCSVGCAGADTGSCKITSCTNGCTLVCGGADDCENSCGVTQSCVTTP